MRTTRHSAVALAAACALFFAGHVAATTPGAGYGYASPYADSPYADSQLPESDPDGLYLKPGEFAWLPAAAERSDAPVTLWVSLSEQRAFLYRDGIRIAVTTVSTGKPGHDTPHGVFPITEKKKTHFSNKYDNAPMPWMQRLTRWGHALHAGNVRPTPASHGCVRLPPAFAQQLFSLTRRGDLVLISQDRSMQSLERAGIDSQQASLVGAISRRLPNHMVADERARGSDIRASVAAGTSF